MTALILELQSQRLFQWTFVSSCVLMFVFASCTQQRPIVQCIELKPKEISFDGSPSRVQKDTIHLTLMDGFSGFVAVDFNGLQVWSGNTQTDPSTSVAQQVVLISGSLDRKIVVRTESTCIAIDVPIGYSRSQLYHLKSGWRIVFSNATMKVQ